MSAAQLVFAELLHVAPCVKVARAPANQDNIFETQCINQTCYVQQFGKDKLRGVVTIDMSPLPLSPDPKWWTEGTIEELSGRHTGVDFF